LFNLPIDAITIQDIEQFLLSGARENTVFELKGQFPNNLEKSSRQWQTRLEG
jgi:hypothetical protein